LDVDELLRRKKVLAELYMGRAATKPDKVNMTSPKAQKTAATFFATNF
jgi:hypothetical protein